MLHRNVSYLCTKAHGVISQKTWISTATAVRTSNIVSVFFPQYKVRPVSSQLSVGMRSDCVLGILFLL